jgi:hypothetical protein
MATNRAFSTATPVYNTPPVAPVRNSTRSGRVINLSSGSSGSRSRRSTSADDGLAASIALARRLEEEEVQVVYY